MSSDKLLEAIHEDVREIRSDMKDIAPQVAQNTKDLSEHIEGVQQNRKRIKHIEDKLTIGYLIKMVIAGIVSMGAMATAGYAIWRLIGMFK